MGHPFCLEPFEQAMVPVSWGTGWITKAPPAQSMAVQPDTVDDANGADVDFRLCIYNDTVDAKTIQHGSQTI